jgi:hypothetical protein
VEGISRVVHLKSSGHRFSQAAASRPNDAEQLHRLAAARAHRVVCLRCEAERGLLTETPPTRQGICLMTVALNGAANISSRGA